MSGHMYRNPSVGGRRLAEPAESYGKPRPTETLQVNHRTHAMKCHTIANSQVISNTVYIPEIKEFTPHPQDATPTALFPAEVGYNSLETPCRRFRSMYDHEHILIYTDGACLNNGGGDAAAGCAFYYRPTEEYETDKNDPGFVSFRLEDTGPSGLESLQTSNRAEIRAVIAALDHRAWRGEACTRITIATDSQYVVHGITRWIRTWVQEGWVTSKGRLVANRDLWEELLGVLRRLERSAVEVQFWRIPRQLNKIADAGAKAGARMSRVTNYKKHH
ncbi:hypothetical protein TWF970_002897 [Orbilia oligospora]|uniref:ribonuclease H n=1 Tax=Orbilia oligospora TaxID=2813651 RepID=A0A7C8R8Z7_ORBOL|nr:hypothetical protein TWF970_002897 [Orbilia oligospora]